MILCVAANPSIDRLFEVEQLRPGAIHRPSAFVQVPGGKGLNVARAAAALGARVRAVALLGGHAGRWIAEEIATEGVELHASWSNRETRSSLTVAGSAEGLTEFYEHGGAVTGDEWTAFADLVAGLAPGSRWVTISGSLPPGAPADGYVPLIGVEATAFDSAEEGLAARPDVVKLNAAEASSATGRPVTDRDEAAAAARILHEATGGAAAVTLGREGAVLITPSGELLGGRVDALGRYPVGSGDAFLAGLVTALDAGGGWPDALRLALGAAAANAEQPGAGRLDPARAEELAAAAVLSP